MWALPPRAAFPRPGVVLPRQGPRRNPDASLLPASGPDRHPGGGRDCALPSAFVGTSARPREATPHAGSRRTPPSSRSCRDHSRCRCAPACRSGHRETGGGSPELRPPTPKGWTGADSRARLSPGFIALLSARRSRRRSRPGKGLGLHFFQRSPRSTAPCDPGERTIETGARSTSAAALGGQRSFRLRLQLRCPPTPLHRASTHLRKAIFPRVSIAIHTGQSRAPRACRRGPPVSSTRSSRARPRTRRSTSAARRGTRAS